MNIEECIRCRYGKAYDNDGEVIIACIVDFLTYFEDRQGRDPNVDHCYSFRLKEVPLNL